MTADPGIKARVRERLKETKTGSTAYFAYGQLRQLPVRVAKHLGDLWHDGCDRVGVETSWEPPLEYQWQAILRQSRSVLSAVDSNAGSRVLFGTSYGFNAFVLALHSMLAAALALRGARPEFLACDKSLPACDWNQCGNMQPDPGEFGPRLPRMLGLSRCRQCTSSLENVYKLFPFATHRLSAYSAACDLPALQAMVGRLGVQDLQSLAYRGVSIGEHANATVVRLLMRASILPDNPHHLWLLRRETLGAAVAVDLVSALLDDRRPDCVVMQHGIYVTHGVMSDLARMKGIRVVVHEWADRKNTFIWSHGQTTHRELIDEPVANWENLELGHDENQRLDEYLDAKLRSRLDWICHYPNPVQDWALIARETGLGSNDRFVALFTNTMWDAQLNYRSVAFPTMLDWVISTLEYARRRPDLKFVFREHPAEARVWGRPGQRILEEVTGRVPEMPRNVHWILAESDISSYALASKAQASVVYGTKLGLELAARGLPVIVAGNAFVRGKGITRDVDAAAAYAALLDQVPGLPGLDSSALARARRYAYHYYFRRVTEIPCLRMENPVKGTKVTLQFRSIQELAAGRDSGLDQICEGILTERPFVFA